MKMLFAEGKGFVPNFAMTEFPLYTLSPDASGFLQLLIKLVKMLFAETKGFEPIFGMIEFTLYTLSPDALGFVQLLI